MCIRDRVVREGLRVFEPGAGGEHKRVRGFAPTVTRSAHTFVDPRLRAIVRPFFERERRAVQEHVDEARSDAGTERTSSE